MKYKLLAIVAIIFALQIQFLSGQIIIQMKKEGGVDGNYSKQTRFSVRCIED